MKEIASLLDLIEKHDVKAVEYKKTVDGKEDWIDKLKEKFNIFHDKDKLTDEELATLEQEKAHLEYERKKLEEQHKHLHMLIAKANTHLITLSNNYVKDLTNGYDVAQVGQKLLDHFGKELNEVYTYNSGYKEIIRFLEDTFNINKKEAKRVFDLLEKNKVVTYCLYSSDAYNFPVYENVDEFVNINSYPLFGKWVINA